MNGLLCKALSTFGYVVAWYGLNGEFAALSVSAAMDGFCDCWLMDLDFSVDIDAPESFYCCHQCKGLLVLTHTVPYL